MHSADHDAEVEGWLEILSGLVRVKPGAGAAIAAAIVGDARALGLIELALDGVVGGREPPKVSTVEERAPMWRPPARHEIPPPAAAVG